MNSDPLEKEARWKLMFIQIGFGILACAMWISTFFVIFGGN